MYWETVRKPHIRFVILCCLAYVFCTAQISTNNICPIEWDFTEENCIGEFNATNYCIANSICRFYNSKLSSNLSTIATKNETINCKNFSLENAQAVTVNNERRILCMKELTAKPLGMQNSQIKDYQLSSSSTSLSLIEPIELKAKFARLENEFIPGTTIQGGWCSNTTDPGEFLQIDFNKITMLTKISTQGVKCRHCHRWTTNVNISYRRSSDDWTSYIDDYDNQTFPTNTNGENIATITFLKPLLAIGIRLYPTGYGNNCNDAIASFCLRAEVYGYDLIVSVENIKVIQDARDLHRYNYRETFNSHHDYQQIAWPNGSFALPAPHSGCPFGSTDDQRKSYRLYDQKFSFGNQSFITNTSTSNLQNTISSEYFTEMFCAKTIQVQRNEQQFPPGDYCIYMLGNTCPTGFQEGSISFYEDENKRNTTRTHLSGITPRADLMFNQSDLRCCSTRMHYCCRNDDTFESLLLPASMPFYLLPKTSQCPNVTDAESIMEYVEFLLSNTGCNYSEIATGSVPYTTAVSKNSISSTNMTFMRYYFCYYQPRVTAFDEISLRLDWIEDVANSNYELDIKLAMFNGRNLIKFLNVSNSRVDVSLISNCTVYSTVESFELIQGEGTYSGAVSTPLPCRENVTIIFESLFSPGKVVSAAKQIKLLSKTTIMVLVYAKDLLNLSSLEQDLTALQSKYSNGVRDINVTIQSYHGNSDLRKTLRDVANRAKNIRSHPESIHGVVAINIRYVQDLITSFINVNDIPFITGSTRPVLMYTRKNTTLKFTMKIDSETAKLFYELQLRNISTLNLVRSQSYKVSASFAYALQRYNIKIENDIIIADDESYIGIKNRMIALQLRVTRVYIMVNSVIASKILIAASELEVSPRYGYTWIHGSRKGVYETAIASKECYKLKPKSCSEEFDGLWMYKSVGHVDGSEAYLKQSKSKLDSNNLGNVSSYPHMELLKVMYIDGTENLIKSFLNQTEANFTIKTADVIQVAASLHLSRLRRMELTTAESKLWPANTTRQCMQGWSGTNCTSPACLTRTCKTKNGRCVANNICECHPGYYGLDCSGDCAHACIHGICNDGRLGNGVCLKCDWLYSGIYCDTASVLQALIASCLGTLVVALIATCYALKLCKPKPHQVIIEDKDEAKWIFDINTLTHVKQVHVDKGVAARHLAEKIRYTHYFKAILNEKDVFVQCIKKKPVKLSLDVRIEIRKVTQLDHVNIEKVMGVCLGPPYVAIVTGLASMGSLYDTLNAENVDIPMEIKYTFMEDICRGMLYLHDTCGITHGRLKSTNCLLHKGWRVKVTDIGLHSLRKRYNSKLINQSRRLNMQDETKNKQDVQFADYNSLLWSAPEYLGAGVTNIDQIEHVTFEGDVYSFGILMAEILTRTPPYGEIKVMSPQHIIEAIAHLREPMVDLEVIRPGTSKAKDDVFMKTKVLRPRVKESHLPKDEPGRSILRLLMESAWSDEPGDRPPFSHIKTVLRIIAPLKGDQMAKRAFLLEKETEVLEKYIAHDAKMISKEQDKINDWFERVLPPGISERFIAGESIDPKAYQHISVAAFQIINLNELATQCNPDELIAFIDYVTKMFNATAKSQGFEIVEFSLMSATAVIISGDETEERNHAEEIVHFSLRILKTLKKLIITFKRDFHLNFKAAIHSGSAINGLVYDFGKTPRLKMIGETVRLAVQLSKQSKPNCLLITNATANLLQNKSKIKLIQRSNSSSLANHDLKLFWVASQN